MRITERIISGNFGELDRIPNSVIGKLPGILISTILGYTHALDDGGNEGEFHLSKTLMLYEKSLFTEVRF